MKPLTRVHPAILGAFAVASLSACSDARAPTGVPTLDDKLAPNPARAAEIAALAQSGRPLRGSDEMGSYLNAAIPGGVGGVFMDASGTLNVYLKDLSRASDARSQLVATQRVKPGFGKLFPENKIEFLQGKYDWDELRGMYDPMMRGQWPAGVHAFDMDESRNRIRIEVTDRRDVAAVKSYMVAHRVPPLCQHVVRRIGSSK